MTENVAELRPAEPTPTTHPYAVGELVLDSIPKDKRVWVPMVDGVWFRPLMFNTVRVVSFDPRDQGWCGQSPPSS